MFYNICVSNRFQQSLLSNQSTHGLDTPRSATLPDMAVSPSPLDHPLHITHLEVSRPGLSCMILFWGGEGRGGRRLSTFAQKCSDFLFTSLPPKRLYFIKSSKFPAWVGDAAPPPPLLPLVCLLSCCMELFGCLHLFSIQIQEVTFMRRPFVSVVLLSLMFAGIN